MKPPINQYPDCPTCRIPSRLTSGKRIYPNRPDLRDKPIWECPGCFAYVGCHEGTTEALGTPADRQLRRARHLLHTDMVDPLWETADACGLYQPEDDKARWLIRRAARGRVYAFLASRLGIPREQTHISHFDLDRCRDAWRALHGLSYPQIREWAQAQPRPERKRKAKSSLPSTQQEGAIAA